MKVLSIDIGIKNLALAIMEHTKEMHEFTFYKMGSNNLCNKIPIVLPVTVKNQAKFYKNLKILCKKHSKIVNIKFLQLILKL